MVGISPEFPIASVVHHVEPLAVSEDKVEFVAVITALVPSDMLGNNLEGMEIFQRCHHFYLILVKGLMGCDPSFPEIARQHVKNDGLGH